MLSPFAPVDRALVPVPPPGRIGWLGAQDYAHRGLHGPGVSENSLAAFAAAADRGFGIELDVQAASDGLPSPNPCPGAGERACPPPGRGLVRGLRRTQRKSNPSLVSVMSMSAQW